MSFARDDSSLFGFGSDAWIERIRSAETVEARGSLGPYELLEEAGRGGQGIVYRARQPGTGRQIALKRLLAGAFASPDTLRRFEREVEASTTLAHPGIVTVYGVDVVEGVPLLTMEWVEGQVVTKWAEGRAIDEILRCFLALCDAVQHAHQRGVLHRDLKPSNVVVDASGRPRVLDFGLAKLVGDTSSSISVSGGFLGTPAYAAPEQWRGEELDVRADVYSLGSILYEMLTGRRVVEGEGLDGLARAASATEPPRPSVYAPVARDLDAIVRQALLGERAERYQSVDALASDVRRFLAGEAVLAHPPTTWYVLRKLVARNRVASALVVALLVGVVGATIAYGVLGARHAKRLGAERDRAVAAGEEAKRERQVAVEQRTRAEEGEQQAQAARAESELDRERAQEESDHAEAVLAFFLEDVIGAVQWDAAGRDPLLSEVVRAAAPRVHEQFADSPFVEARIRVMLGRAFIALGQYRDAEAELRPAIAVRRDDPSATPLALSFEEALLGRALLELGRTVEAEQLLRSAVTRAEAVPGSDAFLAYALHQLAGLLLASERAVEGLAIVERSQALNLDASWRLRARSIRASLLAQLGRASEAIVEFEAIRAEGATGLVLSPFDYSNLGLCYSIVGDRAKALSLLERAQELAAERWGPDHPRVAIIMGFLAQELSRDREHWDEAEALARRSVEILRSASDGSIYLSTHVHTLGLVLMRRGDYVAAEPLFTEAMELDDASLPRGSDLWMTCAKNLHDTLLHNGKLDEADALLGKIEAAVPSGLPGWVVSQIAQRCHRNGDTEGAFQRYEEALGLLAGDPDRKLAYVETLEGFARLQRELGDTAWAEELETQAAPLRAQLERHSR